jgi:hypothetical protein
VTLAKIDQTHNMAGWRRKFCNANFCLSTEMNLNNRSDVSERELVNPGLFILLNMAVIEMRLIE